MDRLQHHLLVILGAFLITYVLAAPSTAEETSQCVICHSSEELIDELTEESINDGPDSEISDLQQGKGYQVKQSHLDLFEKILVSKEFLQSEHGKIPCFLCHKGNPETSDPVKAHENLVVKPSELPDETCGQCHGEITASASQSLHTRKSSYRISLDKRCSDSQIQAIDKKILQPLCMTCHQGTCGSCHVSQPDVAGGGLRKGHLFFKKPDFVYQCLSCHTHPIANDFTGKIGKGDVHFRKYGMTCTSCHDGKEMHASAANVKDRFHLKERPSCKDCHKNIGKDNVIEHSLHGDTVSCTVCHAQEYQNCSSCHMGVDKEGIAYSQSKKPHKGIMIAMNSEKGNPRYVLVREVGIGRNSFTKTIGNMDKFSSQPTYKRTSPHSIVRKTWQTADCNHCHGNESLFLTNKSISLDNLVANNRILVKKNQIPGKVKTRRSFIVAPGNPAKSMRTTAAWLSKHSKDKNVIILDTRTREEYEAGHIPGARHICFCLLRTGDSTTPPYMMQPADQLAKIFSSEKLGLTPNKKVIIYDDGHSGRGVTFLALSMIGHSNIGFLDGNVQAWKDAGYKLKKGKAPKVKKSKYTAIKTDLLVSNSDIVTSNKSGTAIVIDTRNTSQHTGYTRREDIAQEGGAIPASINIPIKSLSDSNGNLYPYNRLSWLLGTSGISANSAKTIITTCNTNMLAAELFMILKYLGYKNVKVHDGSWAEWSKEFGGNIKKARK